MSRLIPVLTYPRMNNVTADMFERVKKECGENCELVKATEWSYLFKCGPDSFYRVSRFVAEEGFEVSASDLGKRWRRMSEDERIDFASNFYLKQTWSDNDTEILDIIMDDGSDPV